MWKNPPNSKVKATSVQYVYQLKKDRKLVKWYSLTFFNSFIIEI